MILTVCPNPCVDCTFEIEKFNVGRLNRIENRIEKWAGKALNTAVGVSRLGKEVMTTGFMFENGGRRCCQYLEKEGVKTDFVWSEGKLRVNYKIIDGKSMMTEINDRGDTVTREKQDELKARIAQLSAQSEFCVISGSLPGGCEDSYYKEMVDSVSKNAKVVVDCEKQKLVGAISSGVFLVKPNIHELEAVNEESYGTTKEMLDGCRKLIDKGTQYVLLSLGPEGAILTDGISSYYCKSENVAVNSTVGAGDSLLAAVCVAFGDGLDMETILRCGVAAGTASVATPGLNLFYRDKYEQIFSKLNVLKM